ncbi:hypothetical protein HPB52_025159 [Rhipicephalus sanguineus]|uniref:Tick transposon n=2 Tax=Rhipicephalus sanguineus TaxID=34632 RepID=A0A9D4YRJ1_RHISA|nr:hypothetical protein HPB52_025159 [Rhipicephalus sanguineus]
MECHPRLTDTCLRQFRDVCSLNKFTHNRIGATVAALHIPRAQGSPPACTPRCCVGNGNHSTHISRCKHRYAQRPLRQKTLPPANLSSSQEPAHDAPTPKNAMARGTAPPPKLPLLPAKTTTVFPSLTVTAPKAAFQPTHSAWSSPGAPPAPLSPHVAALQQETPLYDNNSPHKMSTLEQKLKAYLLFRHPPPPHRTWILNASTASEQSHSFTPAFPTPPPLPDRRNRKPRKRLLPTLTMADCRGSKSAKSPFLVLGDFNVKQGLVLPQGQRPGQRGCDSMLMSFASHCSVPTQPSRVGNSLCRDTTPDLTYCRYLRDAHWSSTHQSLASDHYVLTMQVCTSPRKPRPHVIRHTDWDAFRARRQHSATPDIEDLSQWTDQLLANLNGVTASIPTTANHLVIAFCLTHLQATHTSLTNRGTSNDITIVFIAESQLSTGKSKRTPPPLPSSSGNSAQDFPVYWAASNCGILCPLLDPTSAKSALAILVPTGTFGTFFNAPPTLSRTVCTWLISPARQANQRSFSYGPRPAPTQETPSYHRHLRVLGLILQSNRRNTHTIDQPRFVQQTARIAMRERDLLRLIDAFVISRITYGLPYTHLKCERDKIDVLIHRAYNTALRLPPNASTERLLRLGVHTVDIIEKHGLAAYVA